MENSGTLNLNFIQVVSVHVDGSLILWSMDDLEALCKVVLPSSSSSTLPVLCTLTDESVFLSGILAQSFSQLLPCKNPLLHARCDLVYVTLFFDSSMS